MALPPRLSHLFFVCMLLAHVQMSQCLLRLRHLSRVYPLRNTASAFSKQRPLSSIAKPDFSEEKTAKYFEYKRLESEIYEWWEKSGYFKPKRSASSDQTRPFVVPMPPPNVTGYLHMGHAIFLALQDIMVRYHRMTGKPTLWLPGT